MVISTKDRTVTVFCERISFRRIGSNPPFFACKMLVPVFENGKFTGDWEDKDVAYVQRDNVAEILED